jgi:glycosyltransferase involved in cell wall biosynthesis
MRILLLSLYYPPLNTIAAYRVEAFEKYLRSEGHVVDVITRYYDIDQRKGVSMFLGSEDPADFNEEYIKCENIIFSNFKRNNSKLITSKKLPPIIRGMYNYNNIDVFHYGWLSYMMNAYEKEFSKNKYDFIVSSYGPPVMFLAAKMISEKSKTPYIIDFRDSYIDERDKGLHLFFKKRIQKTIVGNSAGIVFSTEGMRDYFFSKAGRNLIGKPNRIVYNGIETDADFDEKVIDNDIVEAFNKLKTQNDLVLLHTGTLYQGQNIKFFTDSVRQFNRTHQRKIVFIFLGLAENDACEKLEMQDFVYLPKVNRSSAIKLQQLADALVLPVWAGRYTGFSGKTMEYLASGNIVLCSANPQKDMLDFFEKSMNVKVLDNYKMFESVCLGIMDKSILKKSINDSSVFTRKYWVKHLSLFLGELKGKFDH